MPRFLSPAWLDDLAAAAAGVEADAGAPVTVEQMVDGEARYRLRVSDGGVAVLPGAGDADVQLRTDRATAVALARGELAATDALLAGRLRLAGDVKALRRAAPALAKMDTALAQMRAQTTWE